MKIQLPIFLMSIREPEESPMQPSSNLITGRQLRAARVLAGLTQRKAPTASAPI